LGQKHYISFSTPYSRSKWMRVDKDFHCHIIIS
jgi:hypothetical protein